MALLFGTPGYVMLLCCALVYLSLIAYGSFNVKANFFMDLYNQGSGATKLLALTFDDGPSETTLLVLDILKKHGVKATFFVIGNRVEAYPELVKRMVDEGHVIGNHTFNHTKFTSFYSPQKLEQEFTNTISVVFRTVGLNMKLFRPPFGVTFPVMAKVVQRLNLSVIGWSLRSFDTTIKPAQRILKYLLNTVKPGDVILLHDDRTKVPQILEELIPQLMLQNYAFVTVDRMFEIEAYAHE